MPIGKTFIDWENDSETGVRHQPPRHRVLVSMSDELMAAVDGWRSAHGLGEQADAIGELVRLGLMSEIAKIYRMVTEERDDDDVPTSDPAREQRHDWSLDQERDRSPS